MILASTNSNWVIYVSMLTLIIRSKCKLFHPLPNLTFFFECQCTLTKFTLNKQSACHTEYPEKLHGLVLQIIPCWFNQQMHKRELGCITKEEMMMHWWDSTLDTFKNGSIVFQKGRWWCRGEIPDMHHENTSASSHCESLLF